MSTGVQSHEYLAALADAVTDELAVTGLGDATTDWTALRDSPLDFAVCGAMGHAMSVAAGLALGRPERRVIAIEGDGGVLINLGALSTLGSLALPNLLVLVLNNGVYASSGGQPMADVDLAGVARACGIADAHEVRTVEDAVRYYKRWRAGATTMLLALRVAERTVPRRAFARHPHEVRARFDAALAEGGR